MLAVKPFYIYSIVVIKIVMYLVMMAVGRGIVFISRLITIERYLVKIIKL